MKKIYLNLIERTVRVFNENKNTYETCNTYEAGLEPNGELITDIDEIIEHFEDRNDEECEVVFECANELLNGQVISDEDNNDWLSGGDKIIFMSQQLNGYFDNDCEGEITEMKIPDEVGGTVEKRVKTIDNKECGNPYELSDLRFTGLCWVKA